MKVIFNLVDNENHVDRFYPYFHYDNFIFTNGEFQNIEDFDCLISPGNCYGDMTGGFDLSVVLYFGDQIQDKIRKIIRDHYPSPERIRNKSYKEWDAGFMPIGNSVLIETDHRYVCYTPTMETANHQIGKMPNVYMAMNSALNTIYRHNIKCRKSKERPIRKVILCPMGTGFGGLSYRESARQMKHAYDFFHKSYPDMF